MAEEKSDRRLVVETINVPKSVGRDGFLRTVDEILKLSRVQSILIEAKGTVEYKRYIVNGDQAKANVEFEDLEPYAILRNSSVDELTSECLSAAVVITSMIDMATNDGLYPIAFVTGADTVLWNWYRATTGFEVRSKKFLCGLPLYFDRHAPDTALILCAASTRDSSLIAMQRAYKVEMVSTTDDTTVEVI